MSLTTENSKARRGTSNGNVTGNVDDRRRRREWLVRTYRADRDVEAAVEQGQYGSQPACRCYRCGALLTVDTVTVDRIVPGCKGGTYRRNNIRPSCSLCASVTGGQLSGERKKAKK